MSDPVNESYRSCTSLHYTEENKTGTVKWLELMKISPWSRFLEMIIDPELVNNFLTFDEMQRSFTVFTRAFHLALYSAKSSPHLSILHCFFEIHFNIVLQCTYSSSRGACFSGFETEPHYTVILYYHFVSCKEICNKI